MHLITVKRGSAAGVIDGACQVVGNPRAKWPANLLGQEEMFVPGAWFVNGHPWSPCRGAKPVLCA